MESNLISIQEAMQQLNISAVGLDNNIKKKGFKKHYKGRKAFIAVDDFEVIKKTVELNGRVKKIKDKDSEDFELLKRKEELEKENENLKNEIQSLAIKIESTYNATIDLKKDKEDLIFLLEQSNNNLIITQKLLENEQNLHSQEKHRRMQLEEKLNNTKYLLEQSKIEQETTICKNNETIKNVERLEEHIKILSQEREDEKRESDLKLSKLEEQIKNLNQTRENETKESELKLHKLDKIKYKLETKLIEERNNKEIILGELNQYKNMKFKDKLKFLFNI